MPNVHDVRRAKTAMAKRRADYEYFFSQLKSAAWIPPLLEEGFLKDAPAPIVLGDMVQFPFWPESQYLARVASDAPELAASIAKKISTTNPRVQEDVLNLALSIPPKLAGRLVPNIISWLGHHYSHWLLPKSAELVRHLADGQRQSLAFALLKELLRFDPDPKLEEKRAERAASDSIIGTTPEPQPRCEEWDYQKILETAVPALTAIDLIATVDVLASSLTSAIVHSSFESELQPPYDGSNYWRPAVESHSQNWHQSHKHLLVDAIRDTADGALGKGSASMQGLQETLQRYNWHIFKRIYLHLLRIHPRLAGKRITQALTDYELFCSREISHEYALLFQAEFRNLSAHLKRRILCWIESGPDEQLLNLYQLDWEGAPVSESDVEKRVRHWRLKKFALIASDLPAGWRSKYKALTDEFGEPDNPEFTSFQTQTQWSPTSPRSEEELYVLDANAVLEFLRSWEPTKEWMDPSPEGLARAFQNVVKRRPLDFSRQAKEFERVEPTYVRALLSGLTDAVKQGESIPWKPVLALCWWIVKQPSDLTTSPSDPSRHTDSDPDWKWTRKTIPRLLQEGMLQPTSRLTKAQRRSVWRVLYELTKDPDPSREYEQKHAATLRPVTSSINTTRGEAMHAVIVYTHWVTKHPAKHRKSGLGLVKEVQRVLDAHLDVDVEPTLTVRSVYGQQLARLIWLDKAWVKKREKLLFPEEDHLKPFWETAWSSYVVFNQCYDWAYDLLSAQYLRAVALLNATTDVLTQDGNPRQNLADHLMSLYWRGRLTLESPIIESFYSSASADLRAHALEFIGRALKNDDHVPDGVLQRLRTLWEARLASASGKKSESKEISKFAIWFWSDKFSDEWALDQLQASLRLSDNYEREFFVMNRLVRLAKLLPIQCLACLELLIRALHQQRNYFHGREETKQILDEAVQAKDPAVRSRASDVANLLLSLGYEEFRDVALTFAPERP